MRYTLLEMVQQILSAMDSDDVDSINDTIESYQVALLLKGVYYDLAVDLRLPEHYTFFQLDETSSSTPTLMTVPSNVTTIDWVEYDNKLTTDTYHKYERVDFESVDDFLKKNLALTNHSSGVGEMDVTMNDETFEFMYETDRFPTHYTTTDDYNLVFDAYDSDEDTYLTAEKTRCYGAVYPDFTLSDAFAPDLDPTQFSFFLNRAKVRAFAELKQVANAEAAGEARVQKIRLQNQKKRNPQAKPLDRVPRYGRK